MTTTRRIIPLTEENTINKMIPYAQALQILTTQATHHHLHATLLPISKILHRISKHTHVSPTATPRFNTSLVDGYALNSAATLTASSEAPLAFRVVDSVAAGEEPVWVSGAPGKRGIYPCVEVMRGAKVPLVDEADAEMGFDFDCVVRVEDTRVVETGAGASRYIQVMKWARSGQNIQIAGTDFQAGDEILRGNEVVKSSHIMALSSVGISEISVLRKPRVAVFSTGRELLLDTPVTASSRDHNSSTVTSNRIPDVNGPYLTSVLEEWGAEVDFLGAVDDDALTISHLIKTHLTHHRYDLVLATGGVDWVRTAVEKHLGGNVMFHDLAMEPGRSVFFAMLSRVDIDIHAPVEEIEQDDYDITGLPSRNTGNTAFFGLPGNPVDSAACLRFLVLPYLRRLQGQEPELTPRSSEHCEATIRTPGWREGIGREVLPDRNRVLESFPPETDVFRAGILLDETGHGAEVCLVEDKYGSRRIKPLLTANCWIHLPPGKTEVREGDAVKVILSDSCK